MLVCIALLLAMTLIVSCDNNSKAPTADSDPTPTPVEKFTVTFDTDGGGADRSPNC